VEREEPKTTLTYTMKYQNEGSPTLVAAHDSVMGEAVVVQGPEPQSLAALSLRGEHFKRGGVVEETE
jgi:hypothetical protein